MVFNGVLSFVQEGRAQSALSLLRSRLAVHARVRRDGRWQLVDATGLVPGDLVHVRVGDIVPADLTVAEGSVAVDQSVLTGESAEVEVAVGGACYSGSVVHRGEATGEVTATGSRTYFGHTAGLVRTAKTASHLAETIFRVVWALLGLDGALVLAILACGLVTHLPASELLPFVLILVVATVPVALPATFTLATSLGALELARAGVLVTRLSAIEEAAAMDLLCCDKTGTITENRLSVVAVQPLSARSEAEVLVLAAAASDEATQDPIDLAVLTAADAAGATSPGCRLGFVPFDPSTKRSEATLAAGGAVLRVAKGAPSVIASLAPDAVDGLDATVDALAAGGARVLAVAAGTDRLALAGLVALGGPIRPDSPALVDRPGELGIRVVMVTGDTAPTALVVARKVGIGHRLASTEDLRARRSGEIDFEAAAVETGRRVYQRMLTYTLNKIAKTFQVSLFLGVGLLATGNFVTTPRLVLLLLFANDFVTMSLATDRVGFSDRPDRWHVRSLSLAALAVAVPWLAFSFATYLIARHTLGLALAPTQTLVFVMLVATGQATIYLVRERRRLWASRPSTPMLAATAADLVVVTILATRGILMAAVPLLDVAVVLAAVGAVALGLDFVKGPLLASVRTDTNVGHPATT